MTDEVKKKRGYLHPHGMWFVPDVGKRFMRAMICRRLNMSGRKEGRMYSFTENV